MWAGICTALLANIYDKTQLADILQQNKKSRDTIDLYNLLSKNVGVFKDVEREEEPTLQAAMLTTTTSNKQLFQDV